MRRTELGFLLVLLSAAAVGTAGCGVISFDVSQDIPATMIFGDPNSMPVVAGNEAPLTLDIQAETNQRHTGPASAAYLKDLSFTITIPQGGGFYFVSAVTIYLTPKNPNSRLPTVKIAESAPIPDANTIHITPLP